LGEPRNPPEYPAHFIAAGLIVMANYETHIEALGARSPTELESAQAKLQQRGITVRTLDPTRFEADLDLLYDLSVEAFAENLYYSPIDRASFRAQYTTLRPLLDPELVFLASDEDGVVSFLLCYADSQSMLSTSQRGILAKSTATLARARGLGIGGYLMGCARKRAQDVGFGYFLYPLMQVDNVSMHLAKPGLSQLYRRYALYGWEA
jgi:GNAT superfamily N-acetyltransferase